ncbi:hypothetical protein C8F04DRAFT_1124306 [Mycena alexandri]|uniref:Secreted protein n=1 Tax=Mycena alexandri TaxID=1745969 RepID=A0AAD6SF56_9AGAR|nr:hypothetical protein C8F04DRAFT_1124306 [Mycena alexandri]
MQFRLVTLVLFSGVVSASVAGRYPAHPQPSSTSTWWSCPDKNTRSHGKVPELCDSPPHQGSIFGCTYLTGTGTGTHSCTYNVKTGEFKNGGSTCPTKATHVARSHKRKDTNLF